MATLGTTATDGTGSYAAINLLVVSGPYTAPTNGTLGSISMSVNSFASSTPIRGVVFNDSSGTPSTLVGATAEATITGNGVKTVSITGSLVSGHAYWLGFWNSTPGYQIDYIATGNNQFQTLTYASTGDPSPGSWSSSADDYVVYVTYTVPGTTFAQAVSASIGVKAPRS